MGEWATPQGWDGDSVMAQSQKHDTESGEALLTVKEAIEALNVSRRTFYRWLKQGRVHTLKVGRRRMVPLSEIERLKKESLLPTPQRPRRSSISAQLDEISSLLIEMRKREEEAERREEERRKRLEVLAEEIRALREEFAGERKVRKWLIGLLLVVLAVLVVLVLILLIGRV